MVERFSRTARLRRDTGDPSDSGMSLVELIIVVMISSLLLGVLAMIFGNGLSTQQQATERNLATGKANAAAIQLNNAIRDSSAVYLFNTFDNHAGRKKTQLNLTQEVETADPSRGLSAGDLVCQVWIWEDLADGTTSLYYSYYRDYAGTPIPGSTRVSTWDTAAPGQHLARTTGTGGGLLPRNTHLTFDVGAKEGSTSVIAKGGGFAQGKIDNTGRDNPCQRAAGWGY